jgi:uncharacterized protein YggL (DUF469 family)
MRKRLRKKKRLGEFRQYGFAVEAILAVDTEWRDGKEWGDQLIDQFWDAWIAFVEARSLAGGGMSGPSRAGDADTYFDVLVTGDKRKQSPTPEDRAAVKQWLATHPLVRRWRVSGYVDCWHGSLDELDEDLARTPWMEGVFVAQT